MIISKTHCFEIMKKIIFSISTLEMKLEATKIFAEQFDMLEEQEMALNKNFESFLYCLSTSQTNLARKSNRGGKRKGILDGEVRIIILLLFLTFCLFSVKNLKALKG